MNTEADSKNALSVAKVVERLEAEIKLERKTMDAFKEPYETELVKVLTDAIAMLTALAGERDALKESDNLWKLKATTNATLVGEAEAERDAAIKEVERLKKYELKG